MDEGARIADPLAPYVPRLAIDWLADEPDVRFRSVPGTAVFADISGFTNLTERLAVRGKAGAEEMGDLLNASFEQLLTAAYDYGANLVKWGGDAVLLLFDAEEHYLLASRAAHEMQQVMRRIGRVETSRGIVRLGMSIGVHTGDLDFLLVGQKHRELVITGPGASMTAHMEKIAQRGQVVVSAATAALLPPRCLGAEVEAGARLLSRPPEIDSHPNRRPKRADVDLGPLFCTPLREHLRAGTAEHEHRGIAVGFIEFSGTDDLLREQGPKALTEAIEYVIEAAQDAADDNGIALLATDVSENGGKIILTAGAPRATGEDETRVLAAVRRVVHPGGRLALRGGVTSGAVFAGDYGPFYRRTYSIAGDIVNLAARLMAKAEPGQVLATPLVVERSRTPFQTSELEPFAVKGKKHLVRALVVGDQKRTVEGAGVNRLPLVGRDRELNLLLRRVESAAVHMGSVVEIVAPPGMGKSRLLEELVDRSGVRALWYDGDIYSRSVPYHPLHRVLRHALALPADVADDVLIAALRDLVVGTAPDLLPWLPLLGIAAGVSMPSTPEVDQLDSSVRRARLEAVTSDFLGRVLSRPTILVMNDVQFMDEATQSLLARLCADVEARPWLIVVARRVNTAEGLDLGEHAERIDLEPLDPQATNDLLVHALESTPLPAHRMRQLVERAGGHPLFLTMLAAAAASSDTEIDQLPGTVEALIAAQIDRLPSLPRRWLRAASVLGMAFEPRWIEGIVADTDLAAQSWGGLDEFIAMHIDQRLHFAHQLIRLTAYEGLPFRRRTELHARAAAVLESTLGRRTDTAAALLSLHCLRGNRYEAAWHYARVAGERARDQFALAEAAECFRRALDAAAHVPAIMDGERAEVWESLVDAYYSLGESDEVDRALRGARLAARQDPVRFARLCRKTAEHRQHAGRHANALTWVTRGRAAVGGIDGGSHARAALAERAMLAAAGARIRQEQGAKRAAMMWAERALTEATASGEIAAVAEARGIRSVLRAQSGLPWDEVEIAETLAAFETAGNMRQKAWAANTIGMSAYFAGRWDDARAYYEQAEQTCQYIGHEYGAAVTAANRAEVLVQQRRADEAMAALSAALRVLVAAKATSYVSFALGLFARAEMLKGDFELALDRLGEARALALEAGELDEAVSLHAVAVECLAAAGQPIAALALADDPPVDPSGLADAAADDPNLMRARGLALAAAGRAEQAEPVLLEGLHIAQERYSGYEVHECLSALLVVHGDDDLQAMSWRATRDELAARLGIVHSGDRIPTASTWDRPRAR